MALPAEIDGLGEGGERPHPVGRRRLQRDLAGGIDDKRRHRGAGIVLRWLRLPRGQGGTGLGQADRARLARRSTISVEGEPDKRSAELERDHVAQCRGAGLLFIDARAGLACQPRRCRRERGSEQSRIAAARRNATLSSVTHRGGIMPISGSANAVSRRGRIPRQSAPQTSTTPAGSPSTQRGSRSQRSRSRVVCAPKALPRQARACGPATMRGGRDILVDRQDPFRQSERLQQLEVAGGRAVLAAEPEARRHRPQEPAWRRLRRFPHRRLGIGDDAQQGQEIPGHGVGMTPGRRQSRFELDRRQVGEDRNLALAWAANLRWDK